MHVLIHIVPCLGERGGEAISCTHEIEHYSFEGSNTFAYYAHRFYIILYYNNSKTQERV